MGPGLALVVKLVLVAQLIIGVSNANLVFNVQHKFGGRGGRNSSTADGRTILGNLKAHDEHRHGRMLEAIDFLLGGNGLPTGTGLYYTKLTIGTPPKDFKVQVDTGSDNLWLNCAGCDTCPTKTDLGFNLTRYDIAASSTGMKISCDDDFCVEAVRDGDDVNDCKIGDLCGFTVAYGDGSQTTGYYVRDSFKFDKISGDLQTSVMDGGSVAFGCATTQAGGSGSISTAVDGIVGFGQGNSSILSQLASSKKSRRIFSHCLDSVEGGGIFALGEVVEPKVQKTPMVPGKVHYNAYLEAVKVGESAVWMASKVPEEELVNTTRTGTGAIIDSGTTLTYLPDEMHESMMNKIMENHRDIETYIVDSDYTCMEYSKNVDDDFPVVSFHFENGAVLNAYPHDYLFSTMTDEYCFGWMKKAQVVDGTQLTLLGDIVLADKLIVYDLEDMTIGWTEYNCSSSIKVKDENSEKAHKVMAHDMSPASSAHTLSYITLLVSILTFCYFIE